MLSDQRSSRKTQASNTMSAEKKAALRERVAQLMTPEELATLTAELKKNIAEIREICQELLESSDRSSSNLL